MTHLSFRTIQRDCQHSKVAVIRHDRPENAYRPTYSLTCPTCGSETAEHPVLSDAFRELFGDLGPSECERFLARLAGELTHTHTGSVGERKDTMNKQQPARLIRAALGEIADGGDPLPDLYNALAELEPENRAHWLLESAQHERGQRQPE